MWNSVDLGLVSFGRCTSLPRLGQEVTGLN